MDRPWHWHVAGRTTAVRERVAWGLATAMLLSGLASGTAIGWAGGYVWARLSSSPPTRVDPTAPEQLRGPAARDHFRAGAAHDAGPPADPRSWQ